jgi:probable rRNA maturation factor
LKGIRPTIILKRRVPGVSQRALERFATQACLAIGLEGAVTILITGNRDLKAFNARFNKKRQATDVLSFPAPGFAPDFAGDIAISADIAARNARALGHSAADELRVLILHGILHLAGYDHERDGGEMARKELIFRRQLVLPAALIERASPRRKPDRIRPRSHV